MKNKYILNETLAGKIISESICDHSGAILVPEGTMLDVPLINKLINRGVSNVSLMPQAKSLWQNRDKIKAIITDVNSRLNRVASPSERRKLKKMIVRQQVKELMAYE